jgi:hypothetical protein
MKWNAENCSRSAARHGSARAVSRGAPAAGPPTHPLHRCPGSSTELLVRCQWERRDPALFHTHTLYLPLHLLFHRGLKKLFALIDWYYHQYRLIGTRWNSNVRALKHGERKKGGIFFTVVYRKRKQKKRRQVGHHQSSGSS